MKKLIGLLATTLLGLCLALAQDAQTAGEQGSIRIAHIVPDGSQVDVLIDGEVAVEGLEPGSVSGYLLVPAGEHEIEILPAGGAAAEAPATDPAAQPAAPAQPAPTQPAPPPTTQPGAAPAAPEPAEPLATTTVTVEAGAYHTILTTVGQVSMAQQAAAPADTTDAEAAAPEGEAAQAEEPAAPEGEPAEAEAEPAEPAEEEAAQPEGEQAEGAPAAQPEQAQDEAGERAQAQTEADAEIQLQSITDSFGSFPPAGMALVRVVHAAPSAQAVNLVGMLASEEGTAAAEVQDEAAAEDEGAQAEAEPAAPAADEAAQPEGEPAGEEAAQPEGEAAQAEAEPAEPAQEEAAQPEGEQAAAEPAAPEGEAAPAERAQEGPAPIQGQALVSDLASGQVSDYVSVAGGTYHLQVQTADGMVVVDLPDTVLEPGVIYTFYASGRPDDEAMSLTVSVDALIARETGDQ